MLTILGELDGTIDPSFTLTVERAEVEEIRRGLDEIEQLAQQGQSFAEAIPIEDLEMDYPSVAAAAATELAQGTILDADRALLAASLLPRETGWRTLAEGLQTTDAHTAWQETSLREVLGGFRGASPQLVRRIATSTGLPADVLIADVEPDQIARIATQLHEQTEK